MDLLHDGYHCISMRPERYKELLPLLVAALKEVDARTPFEAMAFRGMSGALLVTPLAMALGKNLLMVRKPEDGSHTWYTGAQGDREAKKYIIVDDLQSSGATARAIVAAVKQFTPMTECLGVFEVNQFYDNFDERILYHKFQGYKLTKVVGRTL